MIVDAPPVKTCICPANRNSLFDKWIRRIGQRLVRLSVDSRYEDGYIWGPCRHFELPPGK